MNPTLGTPPSHDLQTQVKQALELAQAKEKELQAAMVTLVLALEPVLQARVKPGDIVDRTSFGSLSVVRGNSRNAKRFEVAGPARLEPLKLRAPELTAFRVEAWPINEQGQRLSGRAGNSRLAHAGDTVTLEIQLCRFGFDDLTSGNDLLLREVAVAQSTLNAVASPS